MSSASGVGGGFDAAEYQRRMEEHRREFEEHRRRVEERLVRWIVPGPGDDPALARLSDDRLVWWVVADVWARDLDLARAVADGVAEAEALEAVLEFFRRRGAGLIDVLSRSVPPDPLPMPPAVPDFDALPPALRAALAACRVDLFIEKHEGPWNWYWPHRDGAPEARPQFLEIAGQAVLLPVAREQHARLTVRRALTSAEGDTLLLELRDAWAEEYYGRETFGGKLAICDRWPGHRFFVCHTYHEWYSVGPGAGAWGAVRPGGEP